MTDSASPIGAAATPASPTFQDVLRARPVVRRHLRRTPLYRYPLLSARLGFDAFVKHENHLPIGAFKVRGGVNLFANLSDAQRRRGVITATRGSHGLSMAWAARHFGSRAVIYVPKGNNPEKNAIMEAMGAELHVFGRDFDEARAEAEARAALGDLRYVHVANEPQLIAGYGTYAMEIAEELPELDAIVVPVGGGSGLAGVVLALRTLRPQARIIAVQAERANAFARSMNEGTPVQVESADTFADGLATRCTFRVPFAVVHDQVDEVVEVSEDEMREGVRMALETTHNVAEGAAAAAYAAAKKLRRQLAGQRVALVHTGQNIDRDTLRWSLGLYDA
ncbi:MAG: threonine dehydratase [Myxococcota bacterium]